MLTLFYVPNAFQYRGLWKEVNSIIYSINDFFSSASVLLKDKYPRILKVLVKHIIRNYVTDKLQEIYHTRGETEQMRFSSSARRRNPAMLRK